MVSSFSTLHQHQFSQTNNSVSYSVLQINVKLYLRSVAWTHFMSLIFFYTHWKHQKTRGVLIFGGHRKRPVAGNGLRGQALWHNFLLFLSVNDLARKNLHTKLHFIRNIKRNWKKTLWSFFMDGVQLSHSYRATSRRWSNFYHKLSRSFLHSFEWP